MSQDTQIDSSSAVDHYEVINGATLTGSNATLASTRVTNSRLVLNGGAVVGGAVALTGVDLVNSSATLTNVMVRADNTALRLQPGSTAAVTRGGLIGRETGATLATGTTLSLDGTYVAGTDVAGIYMGGANLVANGGSVLGGEYGIVVEELVPTDRATIALSGTYVKGLSGPAISVGYPGSRGQADITLSNGATLIGGNGTLVDVADGSQATLNVSGSTLEGNLAAGDNAHFAVALGQGASLVGDFLASDTATASLAMSDGARFTGRLEHVDDVSIASGATWALVEDTTQKNLVLNGGVVRLGEGDSYRTLNVENLGGSGGQFDLHTDFSTGLTDFVNVTGTSSGSHVLNVASSGSDAAQPHIEVARTADGGADFSLLNGRVDLGTWSYQLASDDGKSWYLDGSDRTVSPGTASALALFNTAPSVWYGELTTLRSRMGELRWRSAAPGGWMRGYGNQFNVQATSGIGYRQQQHGLSLGADAPLPWGDGQWIAGVLAGYSQSDLDLQRGTSGTVNSYYAGLYATWLDASSGYYFDALAKANRFRNEADVALSDGTRTDGNYSNLGLGGSVEFGRHIGLNDGWFVEPYAQVSTLVVQGKSFSLDNGLAADGDHSRSLQGKVGATVGRTLDLGEGRSVQPYVRTALAHEFAKRNDVSVNGNRFNNDLAGSRAELGLGVAVNFGSRLQANAGFDYAHGDALEQPWGVSAGLRYNW
ncbi:autotransporter outer membrane beta-barrel domain-containing protein [Pseudomonas entomophila]|uniref:autotransporter outer membrane beta-barrel domain-containing protein n=1 Tax=Pseudomonas sp. RIT-PI-S TaxID=3035295 RepID=UPI0021DA7833